MVIGTANHRFKWVGGGGHMPSGACARATKYMAKSPAKNMSSLDNHTMVPTLTRLGRFNECTRCVIADPEVPTALVTLASMTRRSTSWAIGAEIGASVQVPDLYFSRWALGGGCSEGCHTGHFGGSRRSRAIVVT
ncbi:hypothetical protein RDE2_30160 [Rhodococcus sp. RDE2]|nr:hypothetical protein RDE2_30160 [Rhodococcus sp. RDE2]